MGWERGMNMKYIDQIKHFVMGVVLVSYIYLWCCRLWFENDYVTFIIQIPFLLVFPLNIYLLWIKKDEIFKMFRYYVMRNKLIFISIVLFVFYDVITIFYAMKISYLSTKYIMFFRTLYVIGSLFLCCYDSERNKRGKNIKFLIKCICCILVTFAVTTIIRFSLGMSPYWERVSLRADYNVYARYFLFCLAFYIFHYIKSESHYSGIYKVLYLICGIVSCDLIFLTASRRAIVLGILIVTFSSFFYIIKRKWKLNFKHLIFFVALVGNLVLSIPMFEKHVSTMSEEKKYMHMNFMSGNTPEEQNDDKFHGISEAGLSTRYETIGREEGLATRRPIWNVSIEAIKQFKIQEILFGKGNGYAWNVYENMDDENVVKLLELYKDMEEPEPQWMTPHNFFLTEVLEGGLLKIILVMFLGIVLGYSLIQYIPLNVECGFMLLTIYVCLGANFLLGSTNGLLGEDLFWLTTGILILLRSNEDIDKNIVIKNKE